MLTGRHVRLDLGASTVEGTAMGFDDGGALILNVGGVERSFTVGEVIRVEGYHDS